MRIDIYTERKKERDTERYMIQFQAHNNYDP